MSYLKGHSLRLNLLFRVSTLGSVPHILNSFQSSAPFNDYDLKYYMVTKEKFYCMSIFSS